MWFPRRMNCAPSVLRRSYGAVRIAPFILCLSYCVVRIAPFVMRRPYCAFRIASFVLRRSYCAVRIASFVLRRFARCRRVLGAFVSMGLSLICAESGDVLAQGGWGRWGERRCGVRETRGADSANVTAYMGDAALSSDCEIANESPLPTNAKK